MMMRQVAALVFNVTFLQDLKVLMVHEILSSLFEYTPELLLHIIIFQIYLREPQYLS